MATLQQIAEAIKRADAAGNAEDVRALAAAYRKMQGQPTAGDAAMAKASELSQGLTGKVSDLPSQRPNLGEEVMSFGRGMIEGIPIAGPTLADWRRGLDANIGGLLQGKDPEELKAGYEAADEELRGKTGGARLAGNVAGAVTALAPLGGTALGGRLLGMTGSLPMRVGMGAASGGALSGADTLARGGDLEDAGKSALVGALLGTAFPLGGAAISKVKTGMANNKAMTEALKGAPDVADLKKAASNLFESSRAAQSGIKGDVFANFAANLVNKAKAADIDPMLDGEAVAAYRRMAQMAQEALQSGEGLTFSRLHNLRQIAQDVVVDATKDRTKNFARQIVDGLDDMIEKLTPDQTFGAAGTQAGADLMEGISTWARAKKLGVIEEAITKAGYQKSGVENGLRLQFLSILRDPKKRAMFSPAELSEIERVANGTVGTNIVHLLGKFGFGLGNGGTNALGGTIGALMGGLPGVAVTSGARKLSEVLTSKAAERAAKAVATPNLPAPQKAALADALLAPASLPLALSEKKKPIEITINTGKKIAP